MSQANNGYRKPNNGFHQGRGNRGHSNQDLGNASNILNLRPGQMTSPTSLSKWLLKVKDAIGIACPKYGLKNIILADGTIGVYPVFEEPAPPDDLEDIVAMTLWKAEVSSSSIVKREFKQDIKNGSITAFSMIGELSRFRIEEYNDSMEDEDRYNMDDTIDLLKIAVKTHFSDWRTVSGMQTSMAQKSFINIGMTSEENLVYYYRRWRVLEDAYKKCLENDEFNAENIAMMVGNEESNAMRFINSLDLNRFANLISMYRTRQRDWPDTLVEAYNDSSIWIDNQVSTIKRGIFMVATNGEDAKSSNNHCNRCGAKGHSQNACRNNLSKSSDSHNGAGRGGRTSTGRGGRGRGRNNGGRGGRGSNPSSGSPEN